MALQHNATQLAGNLTRDPVVRFLANEQSVASFGLAINRRFKGSDGQMKDDVTFVDIECWGKTAEFCGQYLVKGTPVFLTGRLKLDTWEDKEGKKHQRLKVVADHVTFTQSKAADQNASQRPRGDDPGRSISADPLAGNPPAPGDEPAYATGGNTNAGRRGTAPARPVADDEPPF